MKKIKQSRALSFWVILAVYLVAIAAGVVTFIWAEGLDDLLRLFLADFTGTVIVWLAGVWFGNSSMYDPYWSVAPPAMLTPMAILHNAVDMPSLLVLAAVWIWAIRLTVNWAYTFRNLSQQDWRYDKYKKQSGKMWHLVNFGGINMMPTVIVFLAMVPAFRVVTLHAEATVWTYAAFALCLTAVGLQFVSDRQAHRFRKKSPGEVCDTGLWKYSRHPNYLGEISMWWGVYFILLSVAPHEWKTLTGAAANTFLFVFISIPLMEKRQLENKPGYEKYKKRTSALIPGVW
ncbi:DUF1295 domain-containing protein [uncultured Alistipes sp.]|jgi:hypothetical protein|uniref:DUF1295 domain-containing protein n=1 Tax=uncultured Alistipes sp. TaxID=538949 RepID=UPI0025E7928F|nr:DUF1295 domain-containing protein [uncultured Alistipes sp.]